MRIEIGAMLSSTTCLDFPMDPAKFQDPLVTAKGEERAVVTLTRLHTVWFNTGSLCNITCKNCYMDSSPTNDNLAYLSLSQVETYLDEIAVEGYPVEVIAFTGGEPFMNPEIVAMIEEALSRGYNVLVLSNAMAPMRRGVIAPGLGTTATHSVHYVLCRSLRTIGCSAADRSKGGSPAPPRGARACRAGREMRLPCTRR